jgi:hypothetical protein
VKTVDSTTVSLRTNFVPFQVLDPDVYHTLGEKFRLLLEGVMIFSGIYRSALTAHADTAHR